MRDRDNAGNWEGMPLASRAGAEGCPFLHRSPSTPGRHLCLSCSPPWDLAPRFVSARCRTHRYPECALYSASRVAARAGEVLVREGPESATPIGSPRDADGALLSMRQVPRDGGSRRRLPAVDRRLIGNLLVAVGAALMALALLWQLAQ